MKPLAIAALCLTFSTPLLAQHTFADPANLMGERVKPKDGRELPIDQGASGLMQLLRKLNTRASILNIVAHPDDEDGGMLTYYSRGLGARVADISLTRGEGGQNAVTGDFEDALGLLRTQELLANDRYTGVDQMFGTEADFGFSKTKEEAFAKWTHERVLYDVVRAIRLYRPLVITSTWIGGVTDGHGQHQVAGEIAQEAFVKAGDPTVFPEMIAEGILPWAPLKVYARVPMQAITERGLFDYATGQYTPAKFTNYVTGEVTATTPSADVIVHEGKADPLLTYAAANPADLQNMPAKPGAQLSYVQFARIGLGLQKSQIGSNFRTAPSGKFDVAYHLYGSRIPLSPPAASAAQALKARLIPAKGVALNTTAEKMGRAEGANQNAGKTTDLDPNFFTGIDTSLEGVAMLYGKADLRESLARIGDSINQATSRFEPDDPEGTAVPLSEALKQTDQLIQDVSSRADYTHEEAADLLHELKIKRVQLNDALVLALHLTVESTAAETNLHAGQENAVEIRVAGDERTPTSIWLANAKGLQFNLIREASNAPAGTPPAGQRVVFTSTLSPAFTSIETRPYFSRDDIEQPVYQLSDERLRNAPTSPVALTGWARFQYRKVEVETGRVVHHNAQPVQFVPPLSISLSSHAQVLPSSEKTLTVSLQQHPADAEIVSASFGAPGWKTLPLSSFANPPGRATFQVEPPVSDRTSAILHAAERLKNGESYAEGYRPVGYGDLPRTNYYTPAADRIVPVDLKLPARHKIAYLPGTGDSVPEALGSIGLAPTMLMVADLTPAKLTQYDTVILGVRTYAAHPDLHGAPTQALIDYAKAGGNVVVQYQTPEFTAADAPYPLALGSNEKVVDETAPVRLIDEKIDPGVRLFYAPNHITPADFDHWIEERGHGFLSTWDPRYSAPTETHDPGQDPQRGGLITVKMGDDPKHQGRWTYCAFALYRQLPEAVPGAYRFFMNLLEPE